MAGLWVVNFLFGLYLADRVQIVQFTHYDFLLSLLSFDQDAKEVRPLWCMEKYWSVVHFVFQHSQSFKSTCIYLPQQIKPLTRLLKDNFTVRTHVSCAFILVTLLENLLTRLSVIIKISFQTTGHAEVIKKQGVLVDVLKNAKFSFGQRQLISVFKVVMRVESLFRIVLLCRQDD